MTQFTDLSILEKYTVMFPNVAGELIAIVDVVDSNEGTELVTTLPNCPFESIITL
jgi:hypothetical protein